MIYPERVPSGGGGGEDHIEADHDTQRKVVALISRKFCLTLPALRIKYADHPQRTGPRLIGGCRRRLVSPPVCRTRYGGCSSHSGRRSFVTRAARKISEVGGSLRDVQQLAGYASLGTTARYIEADVDPQWKVVALI